MDAGPYDGRGQNWSWALTGVLLASCVVVPCVFTTRIDAVFVVPKLGALWTMLALGIAIVAAGVLRSGRLPRPARDFWFVDVAVASFVALSVAAWVFSLDRGQSLYGERLQYQGLLTLLLYVGFFYLARISITDCRGMRLLFFAVAIGATLVAGYALVQKSGRDPVWEGYLPGGRVFSSIGQANALAAYLVLAIPVSAALAVGPRRAIRAAVAVAVAAMIAALALTRSRGGFLGLLAVLGVLAGASYRQIGDATRPFRIGLAAALVAAVMIFATGASIAGLPRVSTADPSIRFHLDAWRVAAQVAAENPLLGTGPETFPDVFPRYSHAVLPADRAAALDAFRVESPHNVYLGIAAGSGAPALIAYLAIVAGFFVAASRAARKATTEIRLQLVAVLAGAAGHVVTSAFMSADVTSTWLFWVLMGSALGVASQPSRQTQQSRVPR